MVVKKITTKLVDFAQSMEAAKSQACFRKPCQYFNILAFGIYNLQSKIADTVPATGDLQVILRGGGPLFCACLVSFVLNSIVYFTRS